MTSSMQEVRRPVAPESVDHVSVGHRFRQTAAIVAAALVAGACLAWSWATITTSSASFADQEVVSGNRLGAGELDIAIGGEAAVFAVNNLAAGDTATGELVLLNAGTLPLTYVLSSFAPAGPLRDAVDISAWNGIGACETSPPAGAAVWRVLDAAPATPASPVAGALLADARQLVCLRAHIPITAPTEAQGRRLDLVIGVEARHDIETSERGTP